MCITNKWPVYARVSFYPLGETTHDPSPSPEVKRILILASYFSGTFRFVGRSQFMTSSGLTHAVLLMESYSVSCGFGRAHEAFSDWLCKKTLQALV